MASLRAADDPRISRSSGRRSPGGTGTSRRDCSISVGSSEHALLAAGGVMAGIDAVFSDRADNVFSVVRPPGHQRGALRDGVCFLNNVAAGARYARSAYGIARI